MELYDYWLKYVTVTVLKKFSRNDKRLKLKQNASLDSLKFLSDNEYLIDKHSFTYLVSTQKPYCKSFIHINYKKTQNIVS